MATVNGNATFSGTGLQVQIVGQVFVSTPLRAVFQGKGQLDDFRISNRYDYDPFSPRGDNMQLRKTRFSQEGFFGDD